MDRNIGTILSKFSYKNEYYEEIFVFLTAVAVAVAVAVLVCFSPFMLLLSFRKCRSVNLACELKENISLRHFIRTSLKYHGPWRTETMPYCEEYDNTSIKVEQIDLR